jgi:hypothetical protein
LGLLAAAALGVAVAGCGGPGFQHVLTGPSTIGVEHAAITVVSGIARVSMVSAPVGAPLYRVSTAPTDAVVPVLHDVSDRISVHLSKDGQGGGGALAIELARDVVWQVRLAGGAASERLDLDGATVGGVSIPAGVASLAIRLPAPHGTTEISLGGGASQFTLTVPRGVAVRVVFASGAGTATLGGVRHSGIAGGTAFTEPGSEAAGRVEVNCTAGVGSFTLDRA